MINQVPEHRPAASLADHSPWDVMCNELRTLPVSLEVIESKRLKIEAVVMNSSEGETVTDLLITALTPTGKPIVRYELASSPSKPVGSELAALINTARSCHVPGNVIISLMSDCVGRDGRLFFTATEPQGCPDLILPMKRVIPTFEEFARRPEILDTRFKTEALVDGILVRAVATILPDHRESVIEANSYAPVSEQVLPTHHFKARCSDDFWSAKRTREEIIAELIKVTWNVMERVTSNGAAAAAEHFGSPEADERLQAGKPSPLTSETVHVLPSGARLLLEVGDSFACVGIQAQATDESTSFYWVLKADHGLLCQRDPKMISARSAVETLIHGDAQQRLKAIATLDRLKHKQTFSKPEMESVAGFRLAESLSYLNNAIVQVADPRSETQALDILDGIQQIECTFRDPGHSRRNPHDPHFMRLGFCPNGSLAIELVTPIGNHTESVIPSSYFEERGGCEATVEILVNLFDKQTSHGFLQLRSLVESLSRHSDGIEREAARLRPVETKLPSPHDGLSNQAYVMATELAKVYEVASQSSIGEADIFFRNPPQCELVVSNTFGKLPTRLVIEVSKDGARRIDIFTRESEGVHHEEVSFSSPLHHKRDADVLHEIFRLLGEGILEDDIAAPVPPPATLWNSPLYKYLKGVETSHAPSESA